VSISHPSAVLALQSRNPLVQMIPQTPLLQLGAELGWDGQVIPHPPQLRTSVAVFGHAPGHLSPQIIEISATHRASHDWVQH
jgi:hypothetical protein